MSLCVRNQLVPSKHQYTFVLATANNTSC